MLFRGLLPVHQRAGTRHLRGGVQEGQPRAQQGGVPLTEGPHFQGQGQSRHHKMSIRLEEGMLGKGTISLSSVFLT